MFGARPRTMSRSCRRFLRKDYDLTSRITLSSITNYIYLLPQPTGRTQTGTFVAVMRPH